MDSGSDGSERQQGWKRRKVNSRNCPHCNKTLSYKTFKAHKRRYFDRITSEWCRGDLAAGYTGSDDDSESAPSSSEMEYDFSAAETFDSPPPLTESDLFSAQHPRESDSCSDSSGGSLLISGKLFIFRS